MEASQKEAEIEELRNKFMSLSNLAEALAARLAQVEKKYDQEVLKLREENEKLKKENEELKRRLEAVKQALLAEESKPTATLAPMPPKTTALRLWMDKLPVAGRRILKLLAENRDKEFTRTQIATLIGLNPTGGHFNNVMSKLLKNNLIIKNGDKYQINPDLLEGG